jgi:hypothetical protein
VKAKLSKGAGFAGVLRYAMQEGKDPEIVGGNMSGDTPASLAREFDAIRRLRLDVKKPVLHLSLSCPDGEQLLAVQWDEAIKVVMGRLGFTDQNAYVAVRHGDADHDHVHVIASRITLAGALVHDSHDVYRAIEATQEVERTMGLTITEGLAHQHTRKTPSKAEIEQALRTGTPPPRQTIAAAIDRASADHPALQQLIDRLAVVGISTKINQSPTTGRINGLAFELDGVAFKASQLGKSYAWAQFQQRITHHEQIRTSAVPDNSHGGTRPDGATGSSAPATQSESDRVDARGRHGGSAERARGSAGDIGERRGRATRDDERERRPSSPSSKTERGGAGRHCGGTEQDGTRNETVRGKKVRLAARTRGPCGNGATYAHFLERVARFRDQVRKAESSRNGDREQPSVGANLPAATNQRSALDRER